MLRFETVSTPETYSAACPNCGATFDALELARRYRPQLVFTDALMPRLDGREMARRIKEDPDTAAAKVVVMTALYTNVKYRSEGFKVYKVDDYLAKPLGFEQLRAVLQKHLG